MKYLLPATVWTCPLDPKPTSNGAEARPEPSAMITRRVFIGVGHQGNGGRGCLGLALRRLVKALRAGRVYVDKILKGAKPETLRIEQATRLQLIRNLKTAKALPLKVPPSLLAQADQVIE